MFGPVPRDYSFKLNKKVKQLARKSALTYKAKENAIVVVENVAAAFEAPKTKDFVALTKNLQVADKKVLFVLPEANKNVYLSARNLPKVRVSIASNINTYELLDAKSLVLSEDSVSVIEQLFKA